MAVATSTAPSPVRESDRAAMRWLLEESGFPHLVESIAQAVAVQLVSDTRADVDQRLGEVADEVEVVVLDALTRVALSHGWKGAK